jgi:hypothetical protein
LYIGGVFEGGNNEPIKMIFSVFKDGTLKSKLNREKHRGIRTKNLGAF